MTIKRYKLVERIVRALNLPPQKRTLAYFTKEQLTRLYFYIEDAEELKRTYDALQKQAETSNEKAQ